MSAWTYCHSDGKAAPKIVPPRLRIPYWKGPGADSEEKHEPASDFDTAVVDSLKALDPERPIREADITTRSSHVRFASNSGHDPDIVRCPLSAKSGHRAASFDHLVGERKQIVGYFGADSFAVLRLISNSNFVGCNTSNRAGVAPLRMRPV